MSLQRRRERYLIIHMWKVRMAQVPNDLNIKFHYNDRLGLREIVPKAPQSHVGSVFHNSFAVKGPWLWNMLPKDLTLADNLESFKTKLDRLLLSFRDTPPISGDETQIPTHCWTDQGKDLQQKVARRTTAEYDGLVDPSHYLLKGTQR